jgi:formate hydrogenlyase transcriptional activator
MQPSPDAGSFSFSPEAPAFVSQTAGSQTLEDLLNGLAGALHDVAPFDYLALILHEPARQTMRVALQVPAVDRPSTEMPVGFGPSGQVWQTQKTEVLRADGTGDDPLPPSMHFSRDQGIRVVCFTPLTTVRSRLGVLVFGSRGIDDYSPEFVMRMEAVAQQVAVAIERTLEFERLAGDGRRSSSERDRTQLLLRVSNAVASELNLPDLLNRIASLLRETIPRFIASVSLWDPESRELRRQLLVAPEGYEQASASVAASDRSSPPRQAFEQRVTLRFCREDIVARSGEESARIMDTVGMRSVCCTPLTTPRGTFGTLNVASPEHHEFPLEDVELVEQIAAQLAPAVENAMQVARLGRVQERVTSERDRFELLLRVSSAMFSELDLTALLAVISRELRDTIEHHYASVTLWDAAAGRLRREALVSRGGTKLLEAGALVREGDSLPKRAFEAGRTIVFSRAEIEAVGGEPSRVMIAENFGSACSVPLQTGRAKYGTLNFASPEHDAFPPAEVELLEQIARQMAMAIENATHFQQAERYRREASAQRDRLGVLLEVNNALVSQLDSHSLRLSVLHAVRRAIGHDYASLAIYDRDTRELRIEAMTYYDDRGVMEPRIVLPMDASPAGLTFKGGVTRVFSGHALDQFNIQGIPTLRSAGLQTICCVPLVTRRGILGTLNIASRQLDAIAPADIDLLNEVAGQVAIAVENTLAYQVISELKDKLAEEKLYLEGEISLQQGFEDIVGSSSALRAVLQQVRSVAPTDATVLLLGETGTGKELLARAVHTLSRRADRTFIRLNGAALPAGLIESELFGYEKGAFTGAGASKVGRLELAHRGTLFLDEVGDLPLEVQPKLLRALQEQEFERLGSTRTQRVDVRLIAATHRDLGDMVASGSFRSDLFYRLNVFPIHVPALRDRSEDIPPLVQYFVAKFARELGRHIATIPAITMQALQRWDWPGNIRELENVIERAVIVSSGPVLQVPSGALQPAGRAVQAPAEPIGRFLDGEREIILRALREAKGVIAGETGAAARLGLKRTTLQSKMRKLGITRPSF